MHGQDVSGRFVETNAAGGFTIEYEEGPKMGLFVHFFARGEVEDLMRNLEPIQPIRRDRTVRRPAAAGHWDQWEGIWRTAAEPSEPS